MIRLQRPCDCFLDRRSRAFAFQKPEGGDLDADMPAGPSHVEVRREVVTWVDAYLAASKPNDFGHWQCFQSADSAIAAHCQL